MLRLRLIPLLLAIAASALVAAGCMSEDTDDGSAAGGNGPDYPIVGSWNGILTQEGVPDFAVGAHIGSLDHAPRNRVHYTGIDCGGNWAFLRKAGSAFLFRETINSGEGGECKGTGTVKLSPVSANVVDYQFRGGGVVSRGTLHRQESPSETGD